ncbi:PAP/fibrillin family protein [Thermaurantiacus sp.]
MHQRLLRPDEPERIARLKRELAALGALTLPGFEAGGAATDRLKTLAAELEALNPTPQPALAPQLHRGRWHLLYSSLGLHVETTLARLTFGALPKTVVTVTEVFQETDPETHHYDNVVHLVDAEGVPATLVIAGHFRPEAPDGLRLRFTEAILWREGARERTSIATGHVPAMRTRLSFLDESFRLMRSARGSLYVLERLDPSPAHWARDG